MTQRIPMSALATTGGAIAERTSRRGGGNQLNPLRRYLDRVNMMHTPNLFGYFPMDEPSGAVALDYSGRGNHGAYTAVALGKEGIGDGRACPLFDGATSNMATPAGFRTAFNSQAGTLAVWVKMLNAGVWADGTARAMFHISADANNFVSLLKPTGANFLEVDYRAGGTTKSSSLGGNTETGFFHFAMTWNKAADELKLYKDGIQRGATVTGLGTWAGTPAFALVGDNGSGGLTSGYLAHPAGWSIALSAQEIGSLT